MKTQTFLFLSLLLLFVEKTFANAHSIPPKKTYFIDAVLGNDLNDGQSKNKPWKTLGKVNSSNFAPGDMILLKRGSIWYDNLTPTSSGSEGKPIVFADYGSGNLPKISVNGKYKDGILLKNISFIKIKNIEITNYDSTAVQKNGPTGVRVLSENFGTVKNIELIGLDIHDINGDNKKGSKEGNGIYWECDGPQRSNIENLIIENCTVKRVDRNGIRGNGTFAFRDNWFPNKNLTIRNCLLEDIGGDGIVIKGFDGALVEHNKLFKMRARAKDNAVGIWPHSSDNTLIQYNEVAYTKNTDWSNDGQSFDIDGNCTNTTIQNNYSHDNDGGFILVISDAINKRSKMTTGNWIKNNLSVNDGLKRKRLFNFAGTTDSTFVLNNVFINNSTEKINMELVDIEGGLAKNIVFENNDFIYSGSANAVFSKSDKQYQIITWTANFFKGNFTDRQKLLHNTEQKQANKISFKGYPWNMFKANSR